MLAALALLDCPPAFSQAPAIQWLGSYDITNTDTRIANDFHATLADNRVKFKFGRTNTIPGSNSIPWFDLKVLNPAKDHFFDFTPADNNFPLVPTESMRFTYLALEPPFFRPALGGALNPALTFLTRDGARLRTRLAGVGVVVNAFGNLVSLKLNNLTDSPLVLTDVRIWRDSALDFAEDAFEPDDENSELVFSQSLLSLGTSFDVPEFLVEDIAAPIIFQALVAGAGSPGETSFQLLAFQFVPEPGAAALALAALTAGGIAMYRRRRRMKKR